MIVKEQDIYSNAQPNGVHSKQLFPSNAKFNFCYTLSKDPTEVIWGSVMSAMTITVVVKYIKLPEDPQEFYDDWCVDCPCKDDCPRGLKTFLEGNCMLRASQVGEQVATEVTLELPDLVIIRRRGEYFLLTYEPESESPHKALNVFNVYDNGLICWGDTKTPTNLRAAWNTFWSTGFNYDLSSNKCLNLTTISGAQLVELINPNTWLGTELLDLTPDNIIEPCIAAVVIRQRNKRLKVLPAEQVGKKLYYKDENTWCYDYL